MFDRLLNYYFEIIIDLHEVAKKFIEKSHVLAPFPKPSLMQYIKTKKLKWIQSKNLFRFHNNIWTNFCVDLYVSVQFSRSVVYDSLQPHESQHARPPCLSPTPGVHSDSRPLSQWCHPAISSSVIPFSSCPQSLPAPESFPVTQLFSWGGQSTGASALASICMYISR